MVLRDGKQRPRSGLCRAKLCLVVGVRLGCALPDGREE